MINELYELQDELNQRIIKEHNLDESSLRNERFLALVS